MWLDSLVNLNTNLRINYLITTNQCVFRFSFDVPFSAGQRSHEDMRNTNTSCSWISFWSYFHSPFIRCSVLSFLSECTHFIWILCVRVCVRVCVCVCVLQDKVGSLFTFDCVCAECGKTRRTRSDLKETHEVIRPQLSIMTQRHITKEKRTVRNRDVLFVPGGGAVALWLTNTNTHKHTHTYKHCPPPWFQKTSYTDFLETYSNLQSYS